MFGIYVTSLNVNVPCDNLEKTKWKVKKESIYNTIKNTMCFYQKCGVSNFSFLLQNLWSLIQRELFYLRLKSSSLIKKNHQHKWHIL